MNQGQFDVGHMMNCFGMKHKCKVSYADDKCRLIWNDYDKAMFHCKACIAMSCNDGPYVDVGLPKGRKMDFAHTGIGEFEFIKKPEIGEGLFPHSNDLEDIIQRMQVDGYLKLSMFEGAVIQLCAANSSLNTKLLNKIDFMQENSYKNDLEIIQEYSKAAAISYILREYNINLMDEKQIEFLTKDKIIEEAKKLTKFNEIDENMVKTVELMCEPRKKELLEWLFSLRNKHGDEYLCGI